MGIKRQRAWHAKVSNRLMNAQEVDSVHLIDQISDKIITKQRQFCFMPDRQRGNMPKHNYYYMVSIDPEQYLGSKLADVGELDVEVTHGA